MLRFRADTERLLFRAKYVLLLGYGGLVIVLASFLANTLWTAVQLAWHMGHMESATRVIGVLEVVDGVMIANVIYLIIRGSYMVYVRDADLEEAEVMPPAFYHLSSGGLKERMAASLVGVSSVHLLQILINVGTTDGAISWHNIAIKVGIHTMLLIGLVVFYVINKDEKDED